MDNIELSISKLGLAPRQLDKNELSFKSSCPSLEERLEEIVTARKFTDVEIVVGDQVFKCHLLVLRCYSEFFDKIAKSDSVDSEIIQLPDSHVSPIAFDKVYKWILEDSPTIERMYFVEVFKAAKYLKIEELVSQCMKIIDDQDLIGEREALSFYLEAIKFDEPFLKDVMMKKFGTIFLTFVSSSEFLDLSFTNIQDLFKLNGIAVNSELDIFFAAILWLESDWKTRREHLIPLMSLVRFELMHSWQLVELKNCHGGLKDFLSPDDMKDMIDEAIAIVALNKSNHDFGDTLKIPKVIKRKIIKEDHLWKSHNFETNHDFDENYQNFSKYLRSISGNYWKQLKIRETRNNSCVE